MSDTFCKTGYPRRIWSAEEIAETHPADDPETPWHLRGVPVRCKLDTEADRYEYTTILKEDERLSTYVPLWLLAWGANMNIQYCTAASFLSYIAKYVPKPETSGMVADNEALRARDNRSARMVRYLNARKVGAPEVVYDIFQYKMKEGQTNVGPGWPYFSQRNSFRFLLYTPSCRPLRPRRLAGAHGHNGPGSAVSLRPPLASQLPGPCVPPPPAG